MITQIIARRLTTIHKNGYKTDYTHITELAVHNPVTSEIHEGEPALLIKGEIEDIAGGRCNTIDRIPIKDIHITIIEWYIPPE